MQRLYWTAPGRDLESRSGDVRGILRRARGRANQVTAFQILNLTGSHPLISWAALTVGKSVFALGIFRIGIILKKCLLVLHFLYSRSFYIYQLYYFPYRIRNCHGGYRFSYDLSGPGDTSPWLAQRSHISTPGNAPYRAT